MKLRRLIKRTIVFLLCVCMLLQFSLSTSAVSGDNGNNSTATTESPAASTGLADELTMEADSTAALKPETGTEVISLREENVKHFDMGNGTYQAIAYSHPVHEQDSEGNWQDIDFSMHLTQTRGVSTYTNSAGTAFNANYVANQPLVTMNGDGTFLDMTFIYAKDGVASRSGQVTTAKADVTQANAEMKTYEDTQSVDFSNTLYYEDVMPGVDLEYIVDPWNVKENIIVKEKALSYTYMFKLNLEGLYPVLQNDGSIFLLNAQTDKQEYVIPAPYMYDAYGEMSFDVSYTITGSNGTYYLPVTADKDWINSENRLFPITIDPTIYLDSQSVNMDTYINEDTPNEARGLYKFFFVGENEVAYIYTPTPELPDGATINSAVLELYYFYKDHVTTGYTDFEAYRVTDLTWAQEWLTWNNVVYSGYENKYGIEGSPQTNPANTRVYANAGATSASPKLVRVGITSALDAWVNGTTNNGIALKYVESPNYSVMFRSIEGLTQYRPRLVYNYVVENVYEVNLILNYDQEYADQCGSDDLAKSRIEDEAKLLAKFFLEKFDIVVHCTEAHKISTLIAECTTVKEDSACACDGRICFDLKESMKDLDAYHHSNIYAILLGLEIPEEDSVRMVFTGSNVCTYANETCTNVWDDGLKGIAVKERRSIVISKHKGKTNENITAIHEMGHMFNTEDHYNDDCNSTDDMKLQYPVDGYDEKCLYGEKKNTMKSIYSIAVCDGCRKRIILHRRDFCG